MWTNKTSGFETTQTDDMKMQMLQIKAANKKISNSKLLNYMLHSLPSSVVNTKMKFTCCRCWRIVWVLRRLTYVNS